MNILEVTTNVIGCTNKCACCPQHSLVSNYHGTEYLDVDSFRTILKNLPTEIQVDFSGYSEPFLNPLCCHLIELASSFGYHIRLFTTLVGIKSQDLTRLSGTSIHYVRFHLPDEIQFRYYEPTWLKFYDKFMELELPCDYGYMALGDVSKSLQKQMTARGVSVIETTVLNSRGGLVAEVIPKTGNLYCTGQRWHYNVLLPNGDVQLCCMDYGLKHKLGNLMTHSYHEIYQEGERAMIADHSQMICSHCEWAQGNYCINPFGKPKFK